MNVIHKWTVIVFAVTSFLGNAVGDALVNTSVQLVKSDPRGQYFLIKRTLMTLLAQRKHDEDLKARFSEDRQVFDFAFRQPDLLRSILRSLCLGRSRTRVSGAHGSCPERRATRVGS